MRWPRWTSRTNAVRTLDTYWDAVARDAKVTPVPPPDVPADLTALIRHLHLAEDADRSRPAYEDRLLQRLLAKQQESTEMSSTAHSRPVMTQRPPQRFDTWAPGQPLREWQPGRLSFAAALTILVVAALVLGQLANRRWNRDEQPVVFAPTESVIDATADATPDDAGQSPLIWEAGGGDNSMLYSTQATIDPDGNIWVADAGHNQFRIYSPDGALVDTWGSEGTGDGQFQFQRAPNSQDSSWADIAFAPDGSFYVADPGNFRVQKFDRDRTFVLAWGEYGVLDGQFHDPLSVAVDGDGNVLVLDDRRDVIQKFTSDGEFLMTIASHGTNPGQLFLSSALTVDADGSIWVADWENHRVQKFGPDGAFLLGFGEQGTGNGQFNYPADVATGPDGTVYVADFENGRIQVFDATGHFRYLWTGGDGTAMINPTGLVVDANGVVYVVVFGRSRLQKYEVTLPDSVASAVVAPIDESTAPSPGYTGIDGASVEFEWQRDGGSDGLGRPMTVAIDPDGNLWVLDGPRDRFEIFGPDGSYLESWGETGNGPGQFDFTLEAEPEDPWGDILFAPDGSFFVADAGNHRIQKFDRDRNFVLAWGTDGAGEAEFRWLGSLLLFPTGELGVVDYSPLSITIYDQNGVLQRANSFALDQPRTVDGDGAIWGVHEAQIRLYGPDGEVVRRIGDLAQMGGGYCFWADMALDAGGNLYVVDRCRPDVQVFDASGQLILTWNGAESPTGMFKEPAAISLDGDGNVYVVDSASMTISKYHVTLP